jgi:hypothetical protein
MTKDEIKHIKWMYSRLTSVHKENENFDYMKRFKEIIDKLLNLHSVRQQRELLLAYQKWYDDNLNICEIGSIEDCVEGFIANNCG